MSDYSSLNLQYQPLQELKSEHYHENQHTIGDYSDVYEDEEIYSYDASIDGHYEATATQCRTREDYFYLHPEEENKERKRVAMYVEDQDSYNPEIDYSQDDNQNHES